MSYKGLGSAYLCYYIPRLVSVLSEGTQRVGKKKKSKELAKELGVVIRVIQGAKRVV